MYCVCNGYGPQTVLSHVSACPGTVKLAKSCTIITRRMNMDARAKGLLVANLISSEEKQDLMTGI